MGGPGLGSECTATRPAPPRSSPPAHLLALRANLRVLGLRGCERGAEVGVELVCGAGHSRIFAERGTPRRSAC
jgi:hypothetical protein